MTSLTWWTITLHPTAVLPDMQPRDVTLEFVRIATTIVALDVLDSVET